MDRYRVLDGPPPYGPRAIPCPAEWGRLGREGLVVEFIAAAANRWTGNFQPGLGGLDGVVDYPDQRHVLVFSSGDLWSVDPDSREATVLAGAIEARWQMPDGLVLSRHGLAFLKVGPAGVVWHTRRLSWDGFSEVVFDGNQLTALAWSPLTDSWSHCSVDLRTGASGGGTYSDVDAEGWEQLAKAG